MLFRSSSNAHFIPHAMESMTALLLVHISPGTSENSICQCWKIKDHHNVNRTLILIDFPVQNSVRPLLYIPRRSTISPLQQCLRHHTCHRWLLITNTQRAYPHRNATNHSIPRHPSLQPPRPLPTTVPLFHPPSLPISPQRRPGRSSSHSQLERIRQGQ